VSAARAGRRHVDVAGEPQSPRRGRQRSTRQARAIEAALAEADGFRTAQELFATMRSNGDRVGLTTVYRHLALLADTDRADVVHTAEGEAQYRLCGSSDATHPEDHHHHIVCRECGRSVEVSAPEIEAWADRVAAAAGYTGITHTVELFGFCPKHSTGRARKPKSPR
jgi:Fur family ferric uptake transcriptional regulator